MLARHLRERTPNNKRRIRTRSRPEDMLAKRLLPKAI